MRLSVCTARVRVLHERGCVPCWTSVRASPYIANATGNKYSRERARTVSFRKMCEDATTWSSIHGGYRPI